MCPKRVTEPLRSTQRGSVDTQVRTPLNATEQTLPNLHLTQNEHQRWPEYGSDREAMEQIADFGAEELIALYCQLCIDLGICSDQAKFAALELIDMAMEARGTLH